MAKGNYRTYISEAEALIGTKFSSVQQSLIKAGISNLKLTNLTFWAKGCNKKRRINKQDMNIINATCLLLNLEKSIPGMFLFVFFFLSFFLSFSFSFFFVNEFYPSCNFASGMNIDLNQVAIGRSLHSIINNTTEKYCSMALSKKW